MSMKKSKLIRGPYGAFKVDAVESITLMNNGVGVLNTQGNLIQWIPEPDETKAQRVADALTDAVIDNKPIDWKQLGYKK